MTFSNERSFLGCYLSTNLAHMSDEQIRAYEARIEAMEKAYNKTNDDKEVKPCSTL